MESTRRLMVGELSEDGNWVWDGSKWNPMNHQNPNHITSPNQSRGPPSIKESNRNKTRIRGPPSIKESNRNKTRIRGPPSIKESNRNKTWIKTPPLKEESLDVPSPALSNYQKPPSSKRNGFEIIATITAGLIGIVVIVVKLLQFAEFLQSGGKGRR
jgi:hypothetical protein